MERIHEAPCDIRGERFEAGVGEEVEDGGDHAAAFGLRGERLGHVEVGRLVASGDDRERDRVAEGGLKFWGGDGLGVKQNGRASCRERGCQYVEIPVVAGSLTTQLKTMRYTEHSNVTHHSST